MSKRQTMEFYCVSVSHENSPLEVRECYSLSFDKRNMLLGEAKGMGIESLLVLSTCNRTELYSSDAGILSINELLKNYSSDSDSASGKYISEYSGKEAVRHLFEVGCGLRSQILGDFQIIRQIKNSIEESRNMNMLDSFTDKLIQQIFVASKRIKNETLLSSGTASVAHAAVRYILDNLEDADASPNILLYGTGMIGKNATENLLKHIPGSHLTLVNRTDDKARKIADKYKVTFSEVKDIELELAKNDIIIVATGADKYTLGKEMFVNTDSPKILLDLSVPRNIDPDIAKENSHFQLISLDELSQYSNKILAQRTEQVPLAKRIVNQEMDTFFENLEIEKLSPTFVALKKALIDIKDSELQYVKKKIETDEYSRLDEISSNIVNKIAREVIVHLRNNYSKKETPVETFEGLIKTITRN